MAVLAAALAAAVVLGLPGAVLPEVARVIARQWARLISRAWREPQRSRHLRERISMVEEALTDDEVGRSATERAVLVLLQTAAGVPGDVAWAARGLSGRIPHWHGRPVSMGQIRRENPELWATVRDRMHADLFRSRPGLAVLARDIGPGVALERYLEGSRDNAEAAARLAKLVVESNMWRQHDSTSRRP